MKSLTNKCIIPVLLFSLFLLQISCSQKKEKNYQDLFVLRILLENATKPKANPLVACVDASKSMELCATTAPEFSSLTLNEVIFASAISKNTFSNYTDYCNNMLSGEMYKNYSDSVRECFFKCDKSYWQTRKNLNICNSSFTTMITGIENDSGTMNCKRNCVTVTNNNP